MTTGAVLRCDGAGGLAAISVEFARHVQPDRALVLNLEDQGRGVCDPAAFSGLPNVYESSFLGAIPDRAIDWLVAPGIDTLISFETWYQHDLPLIAHRAGLRTIIYAMPELAAWPHPARMIAVPTTWRIDQLPNAVLLPWPVARDRLAFTQRKSVAHLFHIAGAAMLDRNGTSILCEALPFISSDVRLTIRAERPVNVPGCNIDVEVINEPVANYWQAYPDDADLLVLPRRYGGLCMIAQEAASLGIPALMLQSDPYAVESFTTTIPSTGSRPERMKGAPRDGIPVHSADPRALASAIDWLVRHPDEHAAASLAADDWAEAHAWSGPLGDRWKQLLA